MKYTYFSADFKKYKNYLNRASAGKDIDIFS